MLTRSDITILMQQVDVTKAYDLLAMFKEAGKAGFKKKQAVSLAISAGFDYFCIPVLKKSGPWKQSISS